MGEGLPEFLGRDGAPGKRCGATLMNGNVVLNINSTFFLPQKKKVKLSRLGWGGGFVLWVWFCFKVPAVRWQAFFFPLCVNLSDSIF